MRIPRPLLTLRPLAASIASRAHALRSETGVALATAVLTLSVLTGAGASVVYFSTSTFRSSAFQADEQAALDLAEAGMNLARSTLWQAVDPQDGNTVPARVVAMEGGQVTYWGEYDGGQHIWTLIGRAELPNPSGAADIVRTASSKVRVNVGQSGSQNNSVWNYLFQDDPNSCSIISNNVEIKLPVYSRGHLCVENNASITASTVQVLGHVEIKNNGSIGFNGAPIAEVHVAGGCKYGSGGSGTFNSPCSAADRVYATTITTAPESLTKPPVDMPGWYAQAAPGPMRNCTQGSFPGGFDNDGFMNAGLPEVNLTPSTPYDCRVYDGPTQVGRIGWTPAQGANPGTLVVDGVIFFDGRVKMSNNANAVYQGRATIYATGRIELSNNAKLCGVSTCNNAWNPNVNMLAFVAGTTAEDEGFVVRNNAKFQGAAYVVNDFREWNNATVYGPIIARHIEVSNNAVHEFIPFGALMLGMPASSTTTVSLENIDGTFTST
jgi:hypothetical protein